MNWFEVNKEGLGKILARRGKQFAIYELLQNAWDEGSTRVHATLELVDDQLGRISVQDNNPDGFADLSHAFTLFADSAKKADAGKRGRFNLGEKLVLALCERAEIASTRGTVIFLPEGRTSGSARRKQGTVFTGLIPMTSEEYEKCCEAATQVIPPDGVATWFNGRRLGRPACRAVVGDVSLPTEVADGEGYLRSVTRKTVVEVYDPDGGGPGWLYEMGIPVVETGDRWHVNIGQKVPLNMDRDNVRPSYLSRVRIIVAERMARELSPEDANSPWVRDAVSAHGDEMSNGLINDIVRLRFGDKRVIYDPQDPEANALAVSRGYTVVHGGHLSKPEWDAVKRVGALLPAGQVTPSPKPFHPDGRPLRVLQAGQYTTAMRWFVAYADAVGQAIMGVAVRTTIANDPSWHFAGAYGRGGSLTVNVAKVGRKWFEGGLIPINEFLVHEFGHEYSGNHLSEEYHSALCRLGGKLVQLALDDPALFRRPLA